MTARQLTNLYDHLGIWERIPLLLAAQSRGDDAELQRLNDSAPTKVWQLPEHLLAEHSLHVLALTYVTEQLDAAANYFFALWKLSHGAAAADDWRFIADTSAYFFTANTEAWRRFCAEMQIAADQLTDANHQGALFHFFEERMPSHAPTLDQLRARWQSYGRQEQPVVTADNLLDGWRRAFRSMNSRAPMSPGTSPS